MLCIMYLNEATAASVCARKEREPLLNTTNVSIHTHQLNIHLLARTR